MDFSDELFESAAAPEDEVAGLTVGQLAWQMRRVLEADPILSDVAVTGEIVGFKTYPSGHVYFTLRDDGGAEAQVRCAMWRKDAAKLAFRPSGGDRIVATGHVEFYAPRGEVTFNVKTLRFAGRGALAEAFARLQKRLGAEGVFDPAKKRPLPEMPRCIGLITSSAGAVAHDVISVLRRRWPLARVLFIPAAVQGFDAADDLLRALSWASAVEEIDVLIIGRGGGAAEDLWAFNDETLVRFAREFPRPLVSAVGHETDFTLLDFAADLRAPTPSAAAELCTPDIDEVRFSLASSRARLREALQSEVEVSRARLSGLRARRVFAAPSERLEPLRQRIQTLRNREREAARQRVKIERRRADFARAQLIALDPMRVLARGYALVSDCENGELVASVEAARAAKKLRVSLHDGGFEVESF